MISGFNTDIEFNGTVYHVQTEDKGSPTHLILSLVYDGGTILASKRSGYEDLARANFDEGELSKRLSHQHKLICAAVKSGRINELIQMTAQASAAGAKTRSAATGFKTGMPPVSTAEPESRAERLAPRNPIKIAIVESGPVIPDTPLELFEGDLIIDAVQIVDDYEILSAEAVAVVSELSGHERMSNQKLSLELLGDLKFKGGDRRTVNIMICRGTERKVVGDAQIMIKVLGSSFRPVIFHAKSDSNGLAKVHLQLPHFQQGRAAVLVRAITGGEEIELRRVVTPG